MSNFCYEINVGQFYNYAQNSREEWKQLTGQNIFHPKFGYGIIVDYLPEIGEDLQGFLFVKFHESSLLPKVNGKPDLLRLSIAGLAQSKETIFGVTESFYQRINPHIFTESNEAQRKEKRALEIQKLCEEKKIEFLFHFTRCTNLPSIMKHGLLSRKQILEENQDYLIELNDSERFDGHENAVCLSIGFPNYKTFYSFRTRFKTKWAVIKIKKEVLWEMNCAFYPQNAASNAMSRIPSDTTKQVEYFLQMFAENCGENNRSILEIPSYYPTNPQAEVLSFDPIPRNYIHEINFENQECFFEWFHNYRHMYPVNICLSDRYFVQRKDWRFW